MCDLMCICQLYLQLSRICVEKMRQTMLIMYAWHSVYKNTINQHIDIPPVFLQLKRNSFF